MKSAIHEAWQFLRKNNHTNPDDVIDYIRDAALEIPALRRENEDLKAKLETACEIVCAVKSSEFEGLSCEDTQGMNWFDARDELLSTTGIGASERLRDKHYRECEEILDGLIEEVKEEGASSEEVNGVRFSKFAIARARGQK